MLYSCYYTKKTPLGYGKIFFLLFSGWDSISMVFKREGKTLELKLSVSCGSRTEDCTQFIFYWKKTVVLHYSLHTTTISKDFRILQIKFLRQRCPEKESQSLSLIYKNGECSLDLVLALLYFKSVCLVSLCRPFFLTGTICLWKLWPDLQRQRSSWILVSGLEGFITSSV